MVKKLFKHEFFAYLRIMAMVYGILLTISLFTRIMLLFESDAMAYEIVMTFTWITYVIAILVAMGFVTVLSIIRFYKNLFTGEGYLSFTLPVTHTQHIWVKAATATVFHIITTVVSIISLCIIMSGDVLNEVCKAAAYIIRGLSEAPNNLFMHLCLYLLEFIIVSVVAIFQSTFVYYTFISIGQLFNKNRILAAIELWLDEGQRKKLVAKIMKTDFSWKASAEKYLALYGEL